MNATVNKSPFFVDLLNIFLQVHSFLKAAFAGVCHALYG